jgi:hypothetical protein
MQFTFEPLNRLGFGFGAGCGAPNSVNEDTLSRRINI